MAHEDLDDWFVNEVLPHEAALQRFLTRNWRNPSEIIDLRQDVYVRVYEAAALQRPAQLKAFIFTTARNLLIDRAHRAKIVSIETVADLEALAVHVDELTPERHAAGRAELRLLQQALGELPPRCREVVEKRRISGLSQREVAQDMGITEDTVERQLSKGLRALAKALLGRESPAETVETRPTPRDQREGT